MISPCESWNCRGEIPTQLLLPIGSSSMLHCCPTALVNDRNGMAPEDIWGFFVIYMRRLLFQDRDVTLARTAQDSRRDRIIGCGFTASAAKNNNNSDWRQMDSIDGRRRILVDALTEIADCEYPLDGTPQMAGEPAQVLHMVLFRRMEHRGWALEVPPNSHSKMRDYNGAVLCDINNGRRRNL